MSDDRDTAWVNVSWAATRFELHLAMVIQGLGRLDCSLIAQDSRFGDLSEADRNTIPEAIRATDRRTLSLSWGARRL